MAAGIALVPCTPAEAVEPYVAAGDVDLVTTAHLRDLVFPFIDVGQQQTATSCSFALDVHLLLPAAKVLLLSMEAALGGRARLLSVLHSTRSTAQHHALPAFACLHFWPPTT